MCKLSEEKVKKLLADKTEMISLLEAQKQFDLATAGLGLLDEVSNDVVLLLVLQRSEHVVLVGSDAHGHVGCQSGELCSDLICNRLVNVETLEGSTGLTGVDERAPEQALGDCLGVCIWQNDSGVVSTELKSEALNGVGRALDDGLTGCG